MEDEEKKVGNMIKSKDTLLFPLSFTEKKITRERDYSATIPRRQSIFNKNNEQSDMNGKLSIITPIKPNDIYLNEDSQHFIDGNSDDNKQRISGVNSPQYKLVLKSPNYLNFNGKDKNQDKDDSELHSKKIFEDSQHMSRNEFGDRSRVNIDFNDQQSEIVKNMNLDNVEVPIVNIPYVPIKKLGCNCKFSRCLKQYCACFRNNLTCKNCKCIGCSNKINNKEREEVIRKLIEKNPNAFDPKFRTKKIPLTSIHSNLREKTMTFVVSRGCSCRNSKCIKKYCECFQYGVKCGISCQCVNCQNVSDSISQPLFGNLRVLHEDGLLGKREEFDIKSALKKKLTEIKSFKLNNFGNK